jgi:hypothetical protein
VSPPRRRSRWPPGVGFPMFTPMPPLDRHCLSCGKNVLSIATRCPACGADLPPPPTHRPTPRRSVHPIFLVAGAAILLVVGLSALALARKAFGDKEVATAPMPTADPSGPLDTASAAASPLVPDSAPTPAAVIRVAQTWTKVRSRRSVHADVVAILLPGDTVLADSLKGGWWRVSLDGRVLGYSWDRTLIGK